MGKKDKKKQRALKAPDTTSRYNDGESDVEDHRGSLITERSPMISTADRTASRTSSRGQGDSHAVSGSRTGNHLGSSPLPPLTPSEKGRHHLRSHLEVSANPSTILSGSFESELKTQTSRRESTRSRAETEPNWRKATIQEVSDEDDVPNIRRHSASQKVPTPPQSDRNGRGSERGSERSQGHSRPRRPTASPYPVSNAGIIYEDHEQVAPQQQGVNHSSEPIGPRTESDEAHSLPDEIRQARRQEKQRRNRADSIESAEMRMAAARSLADAQPSINEDENPRPNTWDKGALQAAYDTLERERAMRANAVAFKRRQAELDRAERRLHGIRVEEDYQFAADMAALAVLEASNLEYAQEIDREQRLNNQKVQERAEQARRYADREEADAARLEQQAAEKRAAAELCRREATDSIAGSIRSRDSRHGEGPMKQMERSVRPPPSSNTKVVVTPSHTPSSPRVSTSVGGPTIPQGIRPTHELYDRIILQRYRQDEINNGVKTNLKDQGIAWDPKGRPYESGDAPSRGSSMGTRGGKFATSSRDARTTTVTTRFPQSPAEGHSRTRSKANTPRPSDAHSQQSKDKREKGTPIKEDRSSGFYSRRGAKPERHGHRRPPTEPSDSSGSESTTESSSSSSTSSRSRTSENESTTSDSDSSEESDPTYQPEYVYSRSDDTDSVWDEDPGETISEVTRAAQSGTSENYTRSGQRYAGGVPPDDSSVSSSDEVPQQKKEEGI
ncbi:hypothetical protein DFH09DRAFT_1074367 [Mycena vulgaris]|nr:hypothetical protein DFH09DRAFT_1074367 [Mycena vulgaris]